MWNNYLTQSEEEREAIGWAQWAYSWRQRKCWKGGRERIGLLDGRIKQEVVKRWFKVKKRTAVSKIILDKKRPRKTAVTFSSAVAVKWCVFGIFLSSNKSSDRAEVVMAILVMPNSYWAFIICQPLAFWVGYFSCRHCYCHLLHNPGKEA